MAIDAESVPDPNAVDSDETLQGKYLEYCSAQMADLLLYLSPDEIYLMADRASRDAGRPLSADRSYTGLVRAATRWLAMRVALPPFEVWLTDYRQHRDRYESYLMGLWEADAPSTVQDRRDA